ncbi:hypothetical protein E1B28_012550 [Marasmius oreades]|uniref:Uncharacterized protein n=2 Tax=Marasmius oreades TaxID=181124 RepID=A0A9P7RSI6_9AGAR|nr:uncharacterized protein E1B28_012550 [Marasmius oreades]KAG7088570.1 hypothetical protein E1B28_012550 [Marasmius oreades]
MPPSRSKLILCSLLVFAVLLLIFPSHKAYVSYTTSQLSPSSSTIKPNAVIFMLLPPSRVHQAILALYNVENRFNRRLKYPYVLFMTEDELAAVSNEDKKKIDWITEGRAKFATVTKESWDIPSHLDKSLVQHSLESIGFSTGYRQMCRFYSGFFWRNPAIANYEWLWRLDTDIEFHCDIPYDPVQRLIDSNKLYGFIQISPDADFVQPSLASNASYFLSTHSHIIPPNANLGFVWSGQSGIKKALQGQASNPEWTRMCMYNNFEISHRSVWESEVYTKFFDYLEQEGGFFYERWSDSPVHSLGLAMSLRKDQVMQFTDMGYQHQGWGYECPQQLDRCTCLREGPAKGFHDNAERWFNATELQADSWGT